MIYFHIDVVSKKGHELVVLRWRFWDFTLQLSVGKHQAKIIEKLREIGNVRKLKVRSYCVLPFPCRQNSFHPVCWNATIPHCLVFLHYHHQRVLQCHKRHHLNRSHRRHNRHHLHHHHLR